MKTKIESILGDRADLILERPELLKNEPVSVSENLMNVYSQYMQYREEDGLDMDSLFPCAWDVVAQHERFVSNLKFVCSSLVMNKKITQEDADDALHKMIDRTVVRMSEVPSDSKMLEKEILQTYSTNATLASGLIVEGAEIDLIELEEQNFDPRIVQHLKKTAFDQYCISSDKGLAVAQDYEFIRSKGFHDRGSKQVEVVYANAKRQDRFQFPRNAEFLDERDGKSLRHLDNEHHESIKIIPCSVYNKNILVKLKIWEGVILGEKE